MNARDVLERIASRWGLDPRPFVDDVLSDLGSAGLVVVPMEIQETPIEEAFWTAENQYKAMCAGNVWPREVRPVYLWSAMIAAALPTPPQEAPDA